jgi:hypothetical protein
MPPFVRRPPLVGNVPTVGAVSPQFDSVILETSYPLSPDDQGSSAPAAETTSSDVYQWGLDGTLDWLSRPPVLPDTSRYGASFVAASRDLSHVVVSSDRPLDPAYPAATGAQLYLVVDKQQGRLISKAPDDTPVGYGRLVNTLVWPTEDYSRILFRGPSGSIYVIDDPVSAGARSRRPTFGPLNVPCDDLRAVTPDVRKVLVACRGIEHPDPAESGYSLFVGDLDTGAVTRLPVVGDFVAADDDMSQIYLLTSRAAGGQLVRIHDGALSVIATVTDNDPFADVRSGSVSADASTLTFQSRLSIGFPNGGFAQLYHYDVRTGVLTCLSCPADGSEPTGGGDYGATDAWAAGPGALSHDGRRVFFATPTSLLASDTNGVMDVYEWLDGELHLISTGTSPLDSAFAGATPDGSEVYFTTNDSLVPQDIDSGIADLYVAKIGGGFAGRSAEVPCTTDCQGPPRALEQLQTPGTVTFTGPGDVDDAAQPATVKVFSVAGIGARARAAWVRGRRAAITVRMSHGGTATAVMRARIGKRSIVVARASRRAAGGGTVSLPLRLSRKARAALRKHGQLRTTVRVTVPGAGGAQSATFVLRAAKPKGARR